MCGVGRVREHGWKKSGRAGGPVPPSLSSLLLRLRARTHLHGRVDELIERVQLLADQALVLEESGDDGPGVLLENDFLGGERGWRVVVAR
jgi:hypothetical protein